MLGAVLTVLLMAAAPPGAADPALVAVQALADAGKWNDAEAAARRYLDDHRGSADGHYLLGYVLYRAGNRQASIAEYLEGARYRAPSALDLQVMGANYFFLEDYGAADEWLTKAVALVPGDTHANYELGRARYNRKHFAEAAAVFQACLRLDPRNTEAADYLGRSYEALGKTAEALDAYRLAVAATPRDAAPYLDLGSLLVEDGHAGDALAYLLQAAAAGPADWHVHRALGKAYLQLNRLPEAVAALGKAVELAPENAPLRFLLSQALRRSGLEDQARAETARYDALTGAHSSPDAPLAEARSLLESGKVDDAERVTRRSIAAHPSSADAHYLLGYILFKKQDPKASLAEYTEAARYRTPRAADLEVVASDYVLLKDYPDADKWFTKAVQWNPGDLLGWYYLGRTKYNENRFEEAIAAFEHCLKLDPRNVKAEDNLGLSYEGLNQPDKAAAAYRTAIEWQQDAAQKDPGPILDLGSLLVNEDKSGEALPYLLEAERLNPGDYRVHRQLGKAYTHSNELEKARRELEEAVRLAPENAPVHFMLAQVYRRQGLLEKAKTESDRYTALSAAAPQGDN